MKRVRLRTKPLSAYRWPCIASAVLCAIFFVLAAEAQSSRPTEFQVKAAYLYNFGKFVRWPESVAAAPEFTICVLGVDPFDGALDQITDGQKIGGVPVIVKRIASAPAINGCRVLFINGADAGSMKIAVATAQKLSVLTVSDSPEFLQRGGMIQFVFAGDKVRFQVNLDTARASGLQLSAELLKVATKVVALSPSEAPR
jgi:hypothetical protein